MEIALAFVIERVVLRPLVNQEAIALFTKLYGDKQSPAEAQRIRDLDLPGIGMLPETKRGRGR